MRILYILILILCWSILILGPINAFAEDKIFSCKPVVGGYPKDGDFYVEDIHDESTPLIDIMPTSTFLVREDGNVYYKNNPSREFEFLVPYERLTDSKEMQKIENSLSSWDEMISLKNRRTFYLRYEGDDGYASLKRISINGSNTKTADITVPDADFPSYFFLRECESENTKKPIQANPSENPFNKIS